MSTSAISGLSAFLGRIPRKEIDVDKAEPECRRLIRKCYQLLGAYHSEPTDERHARLKTHLILMGISSSKKVKSVRKEVWELLEQSAAA